MQVALIAESYCVGHIWSVVVVVVVAYSCTDAGNALSNVSKALSAKHKCREKSSAIMNTVYCI